MRLQLHWVDGTTGQEKSPILETPIAFGRAFSSMPATLKGDQVSRMVLDAEGIEGCHALLAEHKGQLVLLDRSDRSDTLVNGVVVKTQVVTSGDRITIGPFEITLTVLGEDFKATASAKTPVVEPLVAESTVTESTVMSGGPAGGGTKGSSAGKACDRKVGFLFKRRCGRTTTEGCPDCRNGQIDPARDLYADDYAYYPNYGYYRQGYWGSDYYYNRDRYYYDPNTRNVDFNESDAASFEQEGDRDYEMDLDAS